jgi:hypothetical protein
MMMAWEMVMMADFSKGEGGFCERDGGTHDDGKGKGGSSRKGDDGTRKGGKCVTGK